MIHVSDFDQEVKKLVKGKSKIGGKIKKNNMAKKQQKILVKGIEIVTYKKDERDFVSLTDMAKFKSYDSGIVIANWLSTRYTVQFMGAWEKLHNPNFNLMEFNKIKNESGSNGSIDFFNGKFERKGGDQGKITGQIMGRVIW